MNLRSRFGLWFCFCKSVSYGTSARRAASVSIRTYQLYDDGRAHGQPRVDSPVVEDEQLVRGAPYADDEGGRDEHVQEHVENGERAVRPRGVHAPRRRRPPLWPRSTVHVHVLVGRHKTALANVGRAM